MAKVELSQRQKRILRFVEDFSRKKGYLPSIREIGAAVGISSTSVVDYNLRILERERHIQRDPKVSRGIKLLGSHPRGRSRLDLGLVAVPLLGRIAAGQPIPVPEDSPAEETIELTRNLLKDVDGIYALEVKGNSMVDALVNDGDIVVMKHQDTAENGEMVAVWLKDRQETTLKKIYHEGRRVRLQPANPLLKPIFAPAENVEVQGKVIMVVRRLGK
ncbi:MAG: repressor LexA [Chloroflexi bacterium]|nr:repressor LexA [Chloroflexota bacterium]